jgi:hypothetical protein
MHSTPQLLHAVQVAKSESHLMNLSTSFRSMDHLQGFGHGQPKRLLAQDVLVIMKSSKRLFGMNRIWCSDRHAVEVHTGAEFVVIGVDIRNAKAVCHSACIVITPAAQGNHLSPWVRLKPGHVTGFSEPSSANDAKAQFSLIRHT